jgi:hypothetical protein
VAIPPTNPAETPTGNADTPATAPETGHRADAEDPAPGRTAETGYGAGPASRPPAGAGADPAYDILIAYDVEPGHDATAGTTPDTTVGTAAGPDGAAWAGDGSDVVTADTTPPTLDALRTVIDHHRDIQPQDMPSVQIPPGEYGKGEWAPEDVGPDGPPGAIDPGRPERSA